MTVSPTQALSIWPGTAPGFFVTCMVVYLHLILQLMLTNNILLSIAISVRKKTYDSPAAFLASCQLVRRPQTLRLSRGSD
jgi:hypothetical protein